MSSTEDPKLPRNTARRHFLVVAAAAGARLAGVAALATAITTAPARASTGAAPSPKPPQRVGRRGGNCCGQGGHAGKTSSGG
ncbi:hypothetical protein AB9E19_33950, partial [Rhizobium leguminosarum]